ncbi:MAG: hypothetical protein BGO30_09290 [Bacteroidetes bacterium 41-46]|nr:MAG: hypothetical protein BGO30_09290 [Bacteroidetes bacterium 41-46]
METTQYITVVLTATEGKTITNATHSILAKIIYLGVNDSPDNYFEISDEEADTIRTNRLVLENETLYT